MIWLWKTCLVLGIVSTPSESAQVANHQWSDFQDVAKKGDEEERRLQTSNRELTAAEVIAQTFVTQFFEGAIVSTRYSSMLSEEGPFTLVIPVSAVR